MSAPRLVTYLIQLGAYELRIEFAREILAKNVNFSPAWILAILHQIDTQKSDQIRIRHFDSLLRIIGLGVLNQDIVALFEYFDYQRFGKIMNKQFIQLLLPQNNDALKNAVVKRIAEDMEFSFDLKYALKRLFTQIIQAQSRIKSYEGAFLLNESNKNNGKKIEMQQLKTFLNTYGKYPSDSEINILLKTINNGRCKEIDTKIVDQIIATGLKQIQQMSKISPVLLDVEAIHSMSRQDTSPIKRFSPLKHKNTPIKSTPNKRGNSEQQINFQASPLKIMRTTSILQPVDDNNNDSVVSRIYNSPAKIKNQTASFKDIKSYQSPAKKTNEQNTTATKKQAQPSTPFNKISTGQAPSKVYNPPSASKYAYDTLKQHKPAQISGFERRNMLWTPYNQTSYSDIELLRLKNQQIQKQIQLNKYQNTRRMQQIKGQRSILNRR